MVELFRLVRGRTLAFAAFTMYAMRFCVIEPMLELNGCTLQMGDGAFALLVIAICCLISAAYVINDYFDVRSDRISGVRNVVVGKSISRQTTIILHSLLNVIAVGIGLVLGVMLGNWQLGLAFLIVSGLLWFYSFKFKKYFLVNNIMAGILSALIPVSVLTYEVPLLVKMNAVICQETGVHIFITWEVIGFAWFIFLNTLMYEINKDIFSMEGDRKNGFNTIPVKMGPLAARRIITALAVVAMVPLVAAYMAESKGIYSLTIYLVSAIFLPYILYILVVNFKPDYRALQLNLIRLLAMTCVGVSLFLPDSF